MMEPEVKEYTNGEITVVWQPSKCIHSTKCWKELGEVFNPRVRPWINIGGADSKKISEQVSRCPSKALSLKPDAEQETQTASQAEIVVFKSGPVMVKGNISLKHKDGKTESHSEVYLCRCGQSSNKPFCDGTHRKCGFKDE
jgi:uncharacterized Fe-S cluster protein YjdI